MNAVRIQTKDSQGHDIDITAEVLTEVNELRKGGQFKVTTQPSN